MGVKKNHHPGKILVRDYLRPNHMSANALALALRVQPTASPRLSTANAR
jgi:plasmid maintenance system antidote protein VapI